MPLWLKIVFIVLVVLIVLLGLLYYFGMKLQRKQVQQREQLEAMAQTISMLIIDKKRMKLSEAGLPKIVLDQTPKYLRRSKVPVVKAKIGPKIMTLLADEQVFSVLPVKTECKVVLSGIYITAIKSVRGGSVPQAPKKKPGLLAKLRKKADQAASASMPTGKKK